jgi:hypothetical protein
MVAQSYTLGLLKETEQLFARDILAYLAKKKLWRNTLSDEQAFSEDKLWRELRASNSAFMLFKNKRRELDNGWLPTPWDDANDW